MFGVTVLAKSKRLRRYPIALGCLLALLLFLQMGCATGGNNRTTPPPTNYTVTVTGASGAIMHSTQVAVTVQ
jgi:hypothetical protein